jgi:hypothetical protein
MFEHWPELQITVPFWETTCLFHISSTFSRTTLGEGGLGTAASCLSAAWGPRIFDDPQDIWNESGTAKIIHGILVIIQICIVQ